MAEHSLRKREVLGSSPKGGLALFVDPQPNRLRVLCIVIVHWIYDVLLQFVVFYTGESRTIQLFIAHLPH